MAITVRPLVEADLAALASLDADYAARFDLERVVSLASLRFYERSGHSFVAERVAADGGASAATVVGFVLAQAVWTGERPTVYAQRLAFALAAGPEAQAAVVKALVKSSYDSGVYDLLARVPAAASDVTATLMAEGYRQDEQLTFELVLGSRGQFGEARGG